MGLLDAATSDGRVIFFLPWENSVVAGTTDSVTEVTNRPQPKEEEIVFILKEISSYLSPEIQVSLKFIYIIKINIIYENIMINYNFSEFNENTRDI